ncbi:2Fe-2S iron-sulfur cluster-binding protein [Bordetella genomosp. 11]|uniref:CDP-6-deoxy-delta-3,4-glucoseen reductase n=1 Tax=Bordetella genomosp. 11 TaxID=1416808 RepID=A0A261ULF0_9BORD|nr:2Fe-2S iron-sulfur cluster-binding protein [Bordetella genomosp. 11]OZI62714.1 CDP-6-deoxy-delta-3,4-glucoseen reductase [Bordetella genomosp. 11]
MGHRVILLEPAHTFTVDDGASILDAASRAGVALPHECTFGGCGTCRVRIVEGSVAYEEFPLALSEAEHAQGYALACQARPVSDLVLSIPARGPVLPDPVRATASLARIHRPCEDVLHLVLTLPQGSLPDYQPGQYMNILLPDGSARSFSMASPPRAGGTEIELHIRRIPGGRFTDAVLGQAAPGTPLHIEAPLGTFCYHAEDYRPLLMVATGTGLAPIKAILESLLDDPDCPPVKLYWGMRTEADLYMRDVIESWKDRLYEFEFVPVLSRADASWQGRRGHVQDAVAQDYEDLSEHAIYLCGSPDMIVEAKAVFATLGASMEHIYADSFTFQQAVPAA